METEGRGLLRSTTAWLLPIVLLAFIFSAGFTLVINDSTQIKQIVSNSGLYNTVMNAIVAQAADSNSGSLLATIPVQQPEIQTIIHQSFPSSTLALQGNQIIDGTYAWLRGTANQPAFRIDLSPGKQQLAAGLATYLQQRFSTLPACPNATTAATFEPFTATCLPPDININDVAHAVQQQLATSTSFLAQPVITANSFTNKEHQPLMQSSGRLPQTYQHILGLPILMGVIALILIVLGLVATDNRQRQYNRLSFLIVGTGIFAIAVSIVTGKVWQHFGSVFLQSTVNENQLLVAQSLKIINSISNALTSEDILLSLIVIAAGIVLFVMGRTASHSGIPLSRLMTPAPSTTNMNSPPQPPSTI